MYLWDTNILRAFTDEHPSLLNHIKRISWNEIALPSIVVAESLRGAVEYALKATPVQAPVAHQRMLDMQRLLNTFNIVAFDQKCVQPFTQLQNKFSSKQRYADFMIAGIALSGKHIVVTRNLKHFADLLPPNQLENWIA